ncbi:GALA protein, partial [Polypterus senegalus]|nr:galanin peptides-like [Polypterus senegalus]MBN3293865.1 GALA protein [Polypterus senegalus]
MHSPRTLLCATLILYGLVSQSLGMTFTGKDKRGWTLNSAGYLLGPHAHRTLNDKGGLAGKRDILDETYKNVREPYAGSNMHPVDESALQTVLDFLSFLQLKDTGALDSLPVTQEESNLP